MKKFFHPLLCITVAAALLLIDAPSTWKSWAPSLLRSPTLHFGLDLAGGTQLDFRISEDDIQQQLLILSTDIARLKDEGASAQQIATLELQQRVIHEQKSNLTEAIRTVLERRINALGVSEATITPSYVGGEKHLLVECPGVIDTAECIAIVGKTIQLEFKEEFTERTEAFEKEVHNLVQTAQHRITQSGETLAVVGQDLGDELGIHYSIPRTYFRDQLPKGLASLWGAPLSKKLLEKEGTLQAQTSTANGTISEEDIPGIFLAEVLEPRTLTGRTVSSPPLAFPLLAEQEEHMQYLPHKDVPLEKDDLSPLGATLRSMQPGELRVVTDEQGSAHLLYLHSLTLGKEQISASHILVAYNGATAAEENIVRTKEEAQERASTLREEILKGVTSFEELARKESDGPSAKDGGSLGSFARGTMVPAFEEAAFSLKEKELSAIVETPFGFHIIRANSAPTFSPDTVHYDELLISGPDAELRGNTTIAQLRSGSLYKQEEAMTLHFLFFSLRPTGWKDTPLDGKHFRTATVSIDPITNVPVVQISFDGEGGTIFQELTKRNVGKRLAIFVGGELVSAPVVQQEIIGGTAVITGSKNFEEARSLALDLNTGAIPAPIHLSGQYTVEATLGAEALRTSLQAALIGSLLVMLYMLFVYKLPGLLANISLLCYSLTFLALLKLPLFLFSNQYIVLTLAGMAGVILSIGMAIDANVLIFERMKEEIRKGKLTRTAVEIGFARAWPSIRDSNASTILTCVILFTIGTSLVRGFAVSLGMGVLISMFTAIILTRWMLRKIALLPICDEKPWLFGASPQPPTSHS